MMQEKESEQMNQLLSSSFFEAKSSRSSRQSVVSIAFQSEEDEEPELVSMNTADEINFYGIVGILQVFDDLFLVIISKAKQVGRCP